jgi:hypothetical protein
MFAPSTGGYAIVLLLGTGIGLIGGGAVAAIIGLFAKPKQKTERDEEHVKRRV